MAPPSRSRSRAPSAGAASNHRRTSWSRCGRPLPVLPLPSGQAQPQHRPQRAPDLAPGDLGSAGDAVFEPDRHLDHGVSEPARAPDHLDLERVSLRKDVVQPHVSEQVPGIAPESGRAVAGPQAEERAAVEVGAPGQQPAVVRPTFDRAARYVARADRQSAGAPRSFHDAIEVAREMRAVRVHLDEELRAIGEPNAECIFVRTAETKLARTVQDSHPFIRGRQPIRELPGAVGRGVVDDQDVVPKPPDSVNDTLEVLDFVEGGQHHQHPIRHGLAALRAPRPSLTFTTWRNMSIELRIGITLVGAEFLQTTGTSAMRTPFFLARYSTSGS